MSAELPLKIRADIRDKWDSPKAEIHSAVESLKQTLGHKIVPQVQWPLLYKALKEQYADKGTFVPTISRVAEAFYERFSARLENEATTEWTDQLLGELAKKSNWILQIEPSNPNSIARPKITWKDASGAFYLEIPNSPLVIANMLTGFDQDFDNLFSGAPSPALENDDGWAEVNVVETRVPPSVSTSRSLPAVSIPHKLPIVDALARPTELFKASTPYILMVDASALPLNIHGSHEPSLQLLASYLKKWAKTGSNDSLKRPVLKVDLIESPFFFGVLDRILIEPTNNFMRSSEPINPAVILAFIEGVLGYKEVHTTGSRWVFKHENLLS